MLSTQPDFLRHGLTFPSPPRKTASSFLTDGQSVLPLLVLLTFGGSIHGSFYLNQPEALYATPTTRMILFVLCHLMQGFQLSRIERESPAWTLFLPLSRQACKISHINVKNPAKHVKSPRISGENIRKYLFCQFLMKPQNIIYTYQIRFLKKT